MTLSGCIVGVLLSGLVSLQAPVEGGTAAGADADAETKTKAEASAEAVEAAPASAAPDELAEPPVEAGPSAEVADESADQAMDETVSAGPDGATPASSPEPPPMVATTPEQAIPFDLQPSLELYRDGERFLTLGAMMQLAVIPYVGERALLANADPANEEGFRLRRMRIGMQGSLITGALLHVELDLLGSGDGIVNDARLSYQFFDWLRISAGSSKVPYARSQLDSSSSLHFAERPIGTGDIAPANRLGVAAEGSVFGTMLSYVVGVYNGSPGFKVGNLSGGLLMAGRVETAPMGSLDELDPQELRLRVGAGGMYERGATTDGWAISGDAHIEGFGARLRAEVLFDNRSPLVATNLPPTLAGETTRIAVVAEATYILWRTFEVALRYEWYDNNRDVEDFGDQQLFTGGFNVYVLANRLKAQLHYIHRDERGGADIDNDALVIMLQGML